MNEKQLFTLSLTHSHAAQTRGKALKIPYRTCNEVVKVNIDRIAKMRSIGMTWREIAHSLRMSEASLLKALKHIELTTLSTAGVGNQSSDQPTQPNRLEFAETISISCQFERVIK